MPCDDCFDIESLLAANSILGLQYAMKTALLALCGERCGGRLTTVGLNPISNLADSIAEGFPDGLPACDCALLVLRDTTGKFYFSADNAVSWHKLENTKNKISASNPTINDDSGAGYSIGSRWINTSTDREWVCMDATVGAAVWVLVTEATVPGWVEIVPTTTLAGGESVIDISSIPQDYEDLILVVRGRATGTAFKVIKMRFNNDSGLNYAVLGETFTGAAIAYSGLPNEAEVQLVRSNNVDTDTAGYFAHMKAEIFSYARTGISRGGHWEGSCFQDAANLNRSKGCFAWENLTDPITSIQVRPEAGTWVAGTTYALYGRGTAS
jgi:hypothetical protein